LAHIHAATGGPRRATWLVVVVALVVNLICGGRRLAGHGHGQRRHRHLLPVRRRRLGLPDVCYLLVEVAAAWFVGSPKFLDVHGGKARFPESCCRCSGAVVIVVVLWFNVKDAETWAAAPLLGLYGASSV
jgi:hypothetical protein